MVGGERGGGHFPILEKNAPIPSAEAYSLEPSQTSKMEVSAKIAKPISQKASPQSLTGLWIQFWS